MKAHNVSLEQVTPQIALQFLIEGNQRFMANDKFEHNHQEKIRATADKQNPFVAVLSCSDSRVPVELVFDQGLGDVFSVRLAGNVASPNAIGSLEFSCKVLGSKLIVVMGHTGCGAVKGACDHIKFGNLEGILENIQNSVILETSIAKDRTSSNKDFVNKVTKLNVNHNIREIIMKSEILREMLRNGEIGIVGALYHIESGSVDILEQHFLPPVTV
jgi:carbonic anhydrase